MLHRIVLPSFLAAVLTPSLCAQFVINEFMASNRTTLRDEDGDSSDWVELKSVSRTDFSLERFALELDGRDRWQFPAATLNAGDYLVIWCSGKDRTSAPLTAALAPNSPIPFDADLVSLDDSWSYFFGSTPVAPPVDWATPTFDDGDWAVGRPGFGYGKDDIATVLPEGTAVALFRRQFTLSADRRPQLILHVQFDDGILVFLDGVEVLNVGAPVDPFDMASRAVRSHSSTRAERHDLSAALEGLEPGEHTIAIALFNRTATGNDLVLWPELGTFPAVFHTEFTLPSSGGTISLLETPAEGDAIEIDRVEYGEQFSDQSQGRVPDGGGAFAFLLEPSPGAPNEGPSSARPLVVGSVEFSAPRGFHDEPFLLELSSATDGVDFRYTVDGSAPASDHGALYEGPIEIVDTTTLRAIAFADGLRASETVTRTFLFVKTPGGGGLLNQPRSPSGFPSTWGNAGAADYAMDARVTTDEDSTFYDAQVEEALRALPSLSLVASLEDLFDPRTGIYSNPQAAGVAWERPASAEYIDPAGGDEFQINCALRIQGGASRNPNRPKHNMRLLFKTQYGPGKLAFPLFGAGVDEFDTIILRGGNGDSWIHPNSVQQQRAQYIRDQWHRDTQTAMGRLTTRQRYLHLYINGLYWGLYHIFERPSAPFLAAHLGGEREDYDALNLGEPVDGDITAWNTMHRLGAAGVEDPAAYDAVLEYLDAPNLLDFLLINFYSGNVDWDHNNWYAGRRRAPGAGYKFFVWDAERTYWDIQSNRVTLNNASRPTGLHTRLRANADYAMLFADRIQKHFFGDGVLTPESAESRWLERAREIELPLAAETARWGDAKRPTRPYTAAREWRAELEFLQRAWFPRRTEITLGQLRAARALPTVAAPRLSRGSGRVDAGAEVLVEHEDADATVYVTPDGSDPRLPGGELSPSAEPAPVPERTTLVSRSHAVRYLVPQSDATDDAWFTTEFDDGTWTAAALALGFEMSQGYEDDIATDVGEAMHEVNGSIYVRIPFDVDDPAEFVRLQLRVNYDDGFVAYLNGTELGSRNAPADAAWDSVATRSHADSLAVRDELFDMTDQIELLRHGANLLAIHALNRRIGDGDFLIGARLIATRPAERGLSVESSGYVRVRARAASEWSPVTEEYFIVEGTHPLRVTEIMYHSPDDLGGANSFSSAEYDYVEIANVGDASLDLTPFALTSGVMFSFDRAVRTMLAPGDVALVVENVAAFTERYPAAAENVIGAYAGGLSNKTDTIVVTGPEYLTFLEVSYDDDWHPESDGGGRSLEIAPGAGRRDRLTTAGDWTVSEREGGSPGFVVLDEVPTGRVLPGDANGDGSLNLSDAVNLLNRLFGGANQSFACDGAIDSDGNLIVYDVDGGGSVNLSDAVTLLIHLFRGGEPPAHGTECVESVDCNEWCGE